MKLCKFVTFYLNGYIVKAQIRVCIFLHCDFQSLILRAIKNYSLLVKLNQHMKQLRIDKNSKEINFTKPIRELSEVKKEHFSCNMIVKTPFLTNANTLRF